MAAFAFVGVGWYVLNKYKQKWYFHPPRPYGGDMPEGGQLVTFEEDSLTSTYVLYSTAICYKGTTDNTSCMLVAHGNAADIYHSKPLEQYIRHQTKFRGDIYMFEYPGYNPYDQRDISVDNCVNECHKWILYLQDTYQCLDLWGMSIGGGIVAQTIHKFMPQIRNLYLHSTFSSVTSVIGRLYGLPLFITSLMSEEMNTMHVLGNHLRMQCVTDEVCILHSAVDEVIAYDEAMLNFNACCHKNKYVVVIDGRHGALNICH